jgi:hypothetical protein
LRLRTTSSVSARPLSSSSRLPNETVDRGTDSGRRPSGGAGGRTRRQQTVGWGGERSGRAGDTAGVPWHGLIQPGQQAIRATVPRRGVPNPLRRRGSGRSAGPVLGPTYQVPSRSRPGDFDVAERVPSAPAYRVESVGADRRQVHWRFLGSFPCRRAARPRRHRRIAGDSSDSPTPRCGPWSGLGDR